jgi:hypothetical protein
MSHVRSLRSALWTACSAAVVAAGPLATGACGGEESAAGVAPKHPVATRSEALQHEACNEAGQRVETLDTNGDGKPDIRRVFDRTSGKEVCRIADLNHDGKPDLFEYFDGAGQLRRREYCYDDTGVVNAVETYENGKLARREYDTSGQHKIDTWDWFDGTVALNPKTGRPTHPSRRERDSTGDGHIDQWWTWNGDKVTIAVDRNGDGKPDPESQLTIGGGDDGGVPPPAPASSAPAATNAGASAPPVSSSGAGTPAMTPPAPAAATDGGKP